MKAGIVQIWLDSTVASSQAVRQSLQRFYRQLYRHESSALRDHLDGLKIRASAASQAGDMGTLLRDQIDLGPESRARLRANWFGSTAIARLISQELMTIGRAYWRVLKASMRSSRDG